jgi:hypothetical protein
MGDTACIRERRFTYKMLNGKPEMKRPPEYLGANGRIILKWI